MWFILKGKILKWLRRESDENAQKTKNIYGGNLDIGLSILEKQVGKGSDTSLELAIRLEITKSGIDGESAERVPEIISYGAKVNSKCYRY